MKQTQDTSAPSGADLAGRLEKMQRTAYLRSKGIDTDRPVQLDLAFPCTIGNRNDQRFLPNDYARSSLFTARNKSIPRKVLVHEKLFHLHEGIEIIFTGIELRAEDDELVFLQILSYGKGVPLGEPFDFTVKDLLRDINWARNGRYYDKARECISRLKANEMLVLNSKAYGKSGGISLIAKYTSVNDAKGKPTHYRVWVDPNLAVLFAGNTFTCHRWDTYRELSPVARRLADYVESHKQPFPLKLEKFRDMCASQDTSMTSWRQTVRKACAEIEENAIAKWARLKDDSIYCAMK